MPEEQASFDTAVSAIRSSTAPYAQHFAVSSVGKNVSPFVDPASIGLYLGAASLLVSLYFGARAELRQGKTERNAETPSFADLLADLRSGKRTPEATLNILRRWKPNLTPLAIAILIREGARADLEELLLELGYPAAIADLMVTGMQARLER